MWQGNIEKMQNKLEETVNYALPIGDALVPMNPLIGKPIKIEYNGIINCINCNAKTKKSYSQGYCYPCMMKLAACDMCILKPETCHFDQGTCREPDWGLSHCMRPHYVYLANSSGVKVGITRETQIPTRWMDQGAVQALPIAMAQSRYQVGLMEVILKQHMNDKTDWRRMLKNQVEKLDLTTIRDEVFIQCKAEIEALNSQFDTGSIKWLANEAQVEIQYPVTAYPEKVKAQYLIMDTGVINVRKYTGYEWTMSTL